MGVELLRIERIFHVACIFPSADVGSGRRKKTMSRPFGVALLVAGVDKDGPALYCADPSGIPASLTIFVYICA